MRRAHFLPLCLLLTACPSRPPAPDAHAATAVATPDAGPATHVCYGPGGSAVEVARSVPCATLGGSEERPMEVPAGPGVRRDGGTLRP